MCEVCGVCVCRVCVTRLCMQLLSHQPCSHVHTTGVGRTVVLWLPLTTAPSTKYVSVLHVCLTVHVPSCTLWCHDTARDSHCHMMHLLLLHRSSLSASSFKPPLFSLSLPSSITSVSPPSPFLPLLPQCSVSSSASLSPSVASASFHLTGSMNS